MPRYTTQTQHGLVHVTDTLTGTRVYTTATPTEATRLTAALNQPRRAHRRRIGVGMMSGVLALLSLHQSNPDAHRAPGAVPTAP